MLRLSNLMRMRHGEKLLGLFKRDMNIAIKRLAMNG